MKRSVIIIALTVLFLSCQRTPDPAQRKKLMPMLPGIKVPVMALDAFHKGKIKTIDLSLYKRRWHVLFFYPSDFTHVCPTELKELAELYSSFQDLNTEILSVSTDSVFVHKAWKKHDGLVKDLPFPMLSDRSGALSRHMGVYDTEGGFAHRATFLINPRGEVITYEVHHDAIGRSAEELLRKVAAAQAIAEGGPGHYCPAGWKSGEEVKSFTGKERSLGDVP